MRVPQGTSAVRPIEGFQRGKLGRNRVFHVGRRIRSVEEDKAVADESRYVRRVGRSG